MHSNQYSNLSPVSTEPISHYTHLRWQLSGEHIWSQSSWQELCICEGVIPQIQSHLRHLGINMFIFKHLMYWYCLGLTYKQHSVDISVWVWQFVHGHHLASAPVPDSSPRGWSGSLRDIGCPEARLAMLIPRTSRQPLMLNMVVLFLLLRLQLVSEHPSSPSVIYSPAYLQTFFELLLFPKNHFRRTSSKHACSSLSQRFIMKLDCQK